MPKKENIVALTNSLGEINIYNVSKFNQIKNTIVKPDFKLKGHNRNCYGLDWNESNEGLILSAGEDCKVKTNLKIGLFMGCKFTN